VGERSLAGKEGKSFSLVLARPYKVYRVAV
jgi:hypothetical protein